MKRSGEIKKRVRVSAARELAYTALAVALLCVCAFLSVPVGPVPFTLQTFAVAFIGALTGWKRGLAATAVYVFMGLIGLPVFSGFRGGATVLFGPTGGYIFGFFFLVLFVGLAGYIPVKNKWGRAALSFAASILGLAVCYLFGTLWFAALYGCSIGYALAVCVLPYLIPDAVKLLVAALIAVRLQPYIH